MESLFSNGSGSNVEVDDRKQRPRLFPARVGLREHRVANPVGGIRDIGVADTPSRQMEVSYVHDLRTGGRGKRPVGIRRPSEVGAVGFRLPSGGRVYIPRKGRRVA